MDKFIKNNINKIVAVFLILQPFLDVITGICIHTLKINFTIGIIVRVLFLLFISFIVLFIFKKKKIIIPYLIIGLYFIFYIIGTILYKDSNYIFEIQNLVKVFYFPLLFVSLYSIKDYIRISNMTLFTVIFLYLILLFVPTLLGVGYKSYEITKAGTLGFFNSANEISGIISMLTPIMFIIFYESKKIIPITLLIIMYLMVILMIGTKTPLLSLLITIGISILYLWRYLIKTKQIKYIVISVLLILFLSFGLVLVFPKTNFYKNIRTHLDYLKLDNITDVFKDEKLVDHFIFSSRIKFLKNKSKIYNNSNTYQKLFGIGYINNNKETKMIEMDYFDIFFSHGIIGFLIFLSIFIYMISLIFTNKNKYSYQSLMKYTSLFFIILLAFLTGHILIAPSVSLLSIIIIMSISKRDKKDLLFADKSMITGGIEKAQLNLLNNIDYKKYNVTVILEEKTGDLLDKINNNVKVIELKVSDNNNVIIRKIINTYRKLIFKIFNYHNYDFSCCYTTYSYSSNKIAKIASQNNSFYVHSDYSNVYKDEKDFRNFFDSRKVDEYKNIIFVSNESKESFIKYYPELKEKTLVLNNFIDIEEIKEKSKEKIEKSKNKKVLFVFVGRLDDTSKKLKRAIKLVEKLDIELWIIGDGPDRGRYEEYAKELKVSNKITFFGKKSNPYPYIKEADYIILTSDYEGFPVIYQEAMVLRKNIITTINTSDDQINMKEYAYIISKDEKMINEVKDIISKNNKTKEINFEEIQNKRRKQFEKLFNE